MNEMTLNDSYIVYIMGSNFLIVSNYLLQVLYVSISWLQLF